jgi:hypothetical protein
MFTDFMPHKHPHLYNTEEYHIYVGTLTGQATDASLSYIVQELTLTDPYLHQAAMVEVARRQALEGGPLFEADPRPWLPYPERQIYSCVRFQQPGCKCATCNPPLTFK